MEKEEKDIRFVARFYRENRLDTTQAWQKLGIGKQRNNSILLYRLITIAAVTFLIAGFSWWWIYDRQDWIVIASSAHAVKEVTLPDNSHITLAENSALQYDDTLFALVDGVVRFERKGRDKKQVSIYPVAE